ncbi:type IV pilus assembly protein PilM [Salinisphaera sp.]|uniref:type IV pilus biogenesis protein PilM n=1 Tax=Salinisphaera sp. TaxID=1914330 RepID=UPI002D7A18C8|nr:type IV pilus assembly protein PilM [Salinisphaera sp.]HET7312912.1 type IV pilus assembly protein PilM [Salinisphaera sp.]
MGRFTNSIRRRRGLIGIDISARRVKLLELDRSGDQLRVLAYANAPVPDGAIGNFQILDVEAVAQAVLSALERSGSRTRDAAIAVSGPSVISKTILMPIGLDDAEMEQQIHFDAEHHIPHPIEEVNLDFQVLEPEPDNAEFNRVLLVACRRDNIEERTAALEMAHMRIALVDVEEYALQNACALLAGRIEGVSDSDSIAVFDIGYDSTRLTIQRGGRSLYTRGIGFGAAALDAALLDRYQLTDFDTLRAQLRSGEIGAADIADNVREFAERLAVHIDRTLTFYQSASAGDDEPIDHVVLVGGPTLYPGLHDALVPLLPWPISLGNPLDGMLASTAARRNHVDTDAPGLMVAAGLALRGVV